LAEDSVVSPKLSFHATAAFYGRMEGGALKAEHPPMLAAQSAFPFRPLADFRRYSD
jgi:hypothetical protein